MSQPGNANRMRHGLRASKLPAGAKHVETASLEFRRQIERAVADRNGGVDLVQAALISSAVRHERRAMLAERWLRIAEDGEGKTTHRVNRAGPNGERHSASKSTGLSLQDRLNLLREISNASDSRDRCLERLDIAAANGGKNVWGSLHDFPPADDQDAAGDASGSLDGSSVASIDESGTGDGTGTHGGEFDDDGNGN